jgi:tripartite-type tricarboxylate transporter receptor subunit TctC
MQTFKLNFRKISWVFGLVCILVAGVATAQDWPSKPIRIVSPYAAGGVGDTIFRILSPALEAKLGQRLVIDNKTGAAGNIGTQEVVRAAPDGYTFLMAPTANFAVNQHLFKLDFNPNTQLDPVVTIANAPHTYIPIICVTSHYITLNHIVKIVLYLN